MAHHDRTTYNPPVDADSADTDPPETVNRARPDAELPDLSRPELRERSLADDPDSPTLTAPRTGSMGGGMAGTKAQISTVQTSTDPKDQ